MIESILTTHNESFDLTFFRWHSSYQKSVERPSVSKKRDTNGHFEKPIIKIR